MNSVGMSAGLGCHAGSLASAKRRGDAEDKTEIIPPPIIPYFVNADIWIKEAHDEGKRGDQAVPKAGQESCG